MTPAEAAALLTVAAAFDNRKPDADQSRAWAMALDGYRFVDCRDAIVAHYRATSEWLMPNAVITGVKRLRRDRLDAFGLLPDPPDDLTPQETLDWRRDITRRIADGEDVERPKPRAIESAPVPSAIRELRRKAEQDVREGLAE